jgi:hypothetical protein
MVREASGEDSFLLADLPPTKQQIRLALGTVIFLLVVFIALTPFANIHLTRLGPFIAVTLTIVMISDLITSALLFSQFFVGGRTALFVLALSYLFTGLMVFPLMLILSGSLLSNRTFPRGVAERNLLSVRLPP